MNAFSDLHVSFSGEAPVSTRLGNQWVAEADLPDAVWIGTSTGGEKSIPILRRSAGGWRVWVVGEIYSYRGDAADPAGTFVADLASDKADPGLLDAHGVVFAWEQAARRLHVFVDRLGTSHVYVGGPAGRVAVGTCFTSVVDNSARNMDWVGITGFCGFGFYPGDRTMWDDVVILRPATWTVFDENGAKVSQRRTWDWWYEPDHSRTDDDFLEEFHEIWTRTLRNLTGDRTAVVPISSGLDSRTVFATLTQPGSDNQRDRVRPFTYGYKADSQEIKLSQQVAGTRGYRAEELVIRPYLFDRLDDVAGALEGFQAMSFARQAGVSDELRSYGDVVVGGHWGDVWFDTTGASEGGDLVSDAYSKFAKKGRSWLFERLCEPNLAGVNPEDLLRQLLEAEVEALPVFGDPDFNLKVLKTQQWSFRWTLASMRSYQLALPTVVPFYDNDVVDFFLRVPSERLPGRRLQSMYLQKYHPDLAKVRWDRTGMSLFEKPWEPATAFGRRALAKARRTIKREQVIQRNWQVQLSRSSDLAALNGLLGSSAIGSLCLDAEGNMELLNHAGWYEDAGAGYGIDTALALSCNVGGI